MMAISLGWDQVHSCWVALRTGILGLGSKSKANCRKSAHNALAKEIKTKKMKRKYLFLAIAALLAAGGLWLTRLAWRTHTSHKSSMDVGVENRSDHPKSGEMLNSPTRLRPPNPNRKFEKLTP